jgi:hypothetical protein
VVVVVDTLDVVVCGTAVVDDVPRGWFGTTCATGCGVL